MKDGKFGKILKENKFLLFIIMLSAVVLMGSSYAWYTVTIESNKTHTMRAGTLELTLKDSDEEVILTEAVPQTDEEGLKNKAYNFTVTNTGTLASRFTVYLDDTDLTTGTVRMTDSVIKYNLSDGMTANSPKYLNTLKNSSGRRVLVSGVLEPEQSNSYEFKVWLAEEATTEIAGQEFASKITIEGKQVNQPNE